MSPRPGDFRRLVVRYGAAIVYVAALLIVCLRQDAWLALSTCEPDLELPRALMAVAGASLVASLLAARRGWRVLRAGRVPLASDPVLVSTRVRHGAAVRWEAGACFLVAAALVAVALRLSGMWAGAGLPSCG
jgi:cytochrome bd-type quinol oxidase subunit 1